MWLGLFFTPKVLGLGEVRKEARRGHLILDLRLQRLCLAILEQEGETRLALLSLLLQFFCAAGQSQCFVFVFLGRRLNTFD